MTAVGMVPNVSGTDGEGGLLGLAIGLGFASDHWLYVVHTSPTDNRIVRMPLAHDVQPGGKGQRPGQQRREAPARHLNQ